MGQALADEEIKLVHFVLYKRCGKRDDVPFAEARNFFLDYKSVWHDSASDFLISVWAQQGQATCNIDT